MRILLLQIVLLTFTVTLGQRQLPTISKWSCCKPLGSRTTQSPRPRPNLSFFSLFHCVKCTWIREGSGFENQGFHWWIYFKPGIRQCKWWVESQVNRGDSLGEYPSPVIKLLNKFLVLMWIKFEHFWVVIFSGNSNSTRPAFSQVSQRTRRAGSLTILLYEWCDEHLSCGNEFHWTNN